MDNSKVKILVVDDEPDILEFLKYNLEKENYQVFTASNGKAGLAKALETVPDLMILDIMMPEMDGVELCYALRANEIFNKTIIAFLTARNEDFSQIAALESGGDDFITKPIKPRVFLTRIKALLRRNTRSGNEEQNVLQIGDLVVDRDQFLVFKDGAEIELAKKEFELLNLLMSKPGKAYTRDEIFNKIWGRDVIVGQRTIDVHIRKLREKLGDHYIKTVKGVGYKIDF